MWTYTTGMVCVCEGGRRVEQDSDERPALVVLKKDSSLDMLVRLARSLVDHTITYRA